MMPKFKPKPSKPVLKVKRISRTYRFSPDSIAFIQRAIQESRFSTMTSFIEEAATQFASYILSCPDNHKYQKEK